MSNKQNDIFNEAKKEAEEEKEGIEFPFKLNGEARIKISAVKSKTLENNKRIVELSADVEGMASDLVFLMGDVMDQDEKLRSLLINSVFAYVSTKMIIFSDDIKKINAKRNNPEDISAQDGA